MSRDCYSITDIIIASHLIATNRLCSLMYFATLNHLHMTSIQDFDLAGEITLDEKGARRLGQIGALAFGPSGKRFTVTFSSSQGIIANILEPCRQHL
jgi:hypothetical protein